MRDYWRGGHNREAGKIQRRAQYRDGIITAYTVPIESLVRDNSMNKIKKIGVARLTFSRLGGCVVKKRLFDVSRGNTNMEVYLYSFLRCMPCYNVGKKVTRRQFPNSHKKI